MRMKSARIKEWLRVEKSRQIDHAANLATSPDEAIAANAAKILRYRDDNRRARANSMIIVCFGMILCLYFYSLITDFDWYWLFFTGFVTCALAFIAWRTNAGMKSAKDPRYDWAEEYAYDAMRWRDQRRAESKLHEPMKDFKKD